MPYCKIKILYNPNTLYAVQVYNCKVVMKKSEGSKMQGAYLGWWNASEHAIADDEDLRSEQKTTLIYMITSSSSSWII